MILVIVYSLITAVVEVCAVFLTLQDRTDQTARSMMIVAIV